MGASTEEPQFRLMTAIYRMYAPIARATGHQLNVTFVTCHNGNTVTIPVLRALARYLDPRRSLAFAIGCLVFALSIGLAGVASFWVDHIVRADLLDLRSRQLNTAANDIADELNLSFALRLQSVRALTAMLVTELHDENQPTLRKMIKNLRLTSPEFERISVADAQGRVLASTHSGVEGTCVADRPWFVLGMKQAKTGTIQVASTVEGRSHAAIGGTPGHFVDLIASVINSKREIVGVIRIQLSERWLLDLAGSLGEKLRTETGTKALLLDQDGTVLVGPMSLKGKRFEPAIEATATEVPARAVEAPAGTVGRVPQLEPFADGSGFMTARAIPGASDALHALGWSVVLLQPLQKATQGASVLQSQITTILLGLGALAALLGGLLARRMTRDLGAIARSADAIRNGTAQSIAVPPGSSEAARLGRALDELLTSLQRERGALRSLNAELDQRVAARTREIERLGGEARYAAVVRERLKIARDLHDTLAHSMMAMVTEIRLLKRIAATDPSAIAEELVHAEETATQGMKEARAAIAQMRFNPVRDAGLAAALGDLAKQFAERSGITVDYTSDAPAGTFADERAETMFRIAEEAMRNVERHARATRVAISLHAAGGGHSLSLTIDDDGIGFDAEAAHPGHYGLAGLREQARLIGARLIIRSEPQQGTTITVELGPDRDS